MLTNIPTELLRTFLAIAETGSFSQAAEQVHRTQSAISMQVKKLEDLLGKILLNRERKISTLTADGQILANYARRILQLNEEVVSLLKQPELSGWVQIGLPDDFAPRFLPEILARFSRTHPRVQVKVICESSIDLLKKIKQGDIDLAITTTLEPDLEDALLLRNEPTFWAYSPQYLAYEQQPLPLALFSDTCSWRRWATNALDNLQINYRIAYSSSSLIGLQAAVKAGLAITVLSQSALPSGIQQIPAEVGFPPLPQTSIILHKSTQGNQLIVDSLAAHIVEAFGVNQDVGELCQVC